MPVTVTVDNVDAVTGQIQALARKRLMVGIPSEYAPRKDSPITSAAIGYIHEFGSPEANIPARPWLVPPVRASRSAIVAGMSKAATAALAGQDVMIPLHKLGLRLQSAIRTYLATTPFPPLAPSTVAGRLRKTQAGRRQLAKLRGGGGDLASWGSANMQPLVDTGALRNSVSYVIRDTMSGRDISVGPAPGAGSAGGPP